MTDTARTQWLQAAAYWREQERARQREGRWDKARQAAAEALAAEAKARECEQAEQAA